MVLIFTSFLLPSISQHGYREHYLFLSRQAASKQTQLIIEFLIIGAGVSGLSYAIALRRVGHRVVVVEREKEIGQSDVGRGVRLPPNLSKILYRWNLKSEVSAFAAKSKQIQISRLETGDRLGDHYWDDEVLRETQGEFLFGHLADLRKMMYDVAVGQGATVRLGTTAVSVDPKRREITLDSGETLTADVVIGADGAFGLSPNRSATGSPSSQREERTVEEITLAPLIDLQHAVDDDLLSDDPPQMVSIVFPTLKPLGRIGSNTTVLARRSEALTKGAHAINKGFLHHAIKLSRNIANDDFPKQWEALNRTLRDLERLTLIDGTFAYRLRASTYKILLRALETMRRECENSFVLEGETPPPLPQWGDQDDINDVFRPNDFEILGVCFRVEVENFLMLAHKYYDFQSHQPRDRDPDITEAASRIYSSQGNVTAKPEPPTTPTLPENRRESQQFNPYGVPRMASTPPQLRVPRHWKSAYDESTTYPLTQDTSFRNPLPTGLPRGNQRISELFEPMEGLFQSDRSYIPTMEPEEADQMRRMHPQGTSGNSREARQPSILWSTGDPDDDDPDGGNGPGLPNAPPMPPPQPPRNNTTPGVTISGANLYGPGGSREPHFEFKLKTENVPAWDGNVDTIVRWILKVNDIARESSTVWRQLGRIAPRRLQGEAETWYWSLPKAYRNTIEANWDTLRNAFMTYFMNRNWLDRQRSRANQASYREAGHAREKPTQYFIQIILHVMDGAPTLWNTILTTQLYQDVVEFQAAIRFHEEALMKLDMRERDNRPYLGWSSNLPEPKFPKDDRNVSKRATPESKGARPCRHCGSGKHWDNECEHSFKGNRAARTNLASATREDFDAQDQYDDLYYVDEESELTSINEPQSGFEESPQITESTSNDVDMSSALGGNIEEILPSSEQIEADVPSNDATNASETSCGSYYSKPSLNRRSRRRLAREIKAVNYRVIHTDARVAEQQPLIELRKHMARPAGSSFLGSLATEATATIGGLETDPVQVIIDSGSDITLISRSTLDSLTHPPKVKSGHDVKLIQVTGRSSISGYVNVDLYFHTNEGPVKLNVEAYVVSGMSTPFILGNDFADQYSISIVREEGNTYLRFGSSGRQLKVESSTSPSLLDDEGHAFKVKVQSEVKHSGSSKGVHRRNQKLKRRAHQRQRNAEVWATERTVIAPESSKIVPVGANFPKNQDSLFVERKIASNGNEDDFYGAADTLISKEKPVLHVANFSKMPVVITAGQVLGTARNPKSWLDKLNKFSPAQQQKINAHAHLIRTLVAEQSGESTVVDGARAQRNATEPDDPLAEEPLEGGPKTAEVPPEPVSSAQLLTEIDISPDVTPEQRKQLEEVLIRNTVEAVITHSSHNP
ncbi:hypothetical protein R3P38DRAFT_3522434 [Favolaschia claudopus]|uniref:Peptidase A2 domain-containing protein n=1 Tax=Favolaschia claudopus TaxID=2862362 RepID=A0AAW0E5R1_9AGAR